MRVCAYLKVTVDGDEAGELVLNRQEVLERPERDSDQGKFAPEVEPPHIRVDQADARLNAFRFMRKTLAARSKHRWRCVNAHDVEFIIIQADAAPAPQPPPHAGLEEETAPSRLPARATKTGKGDRTSKAPKPASRDLELAGTPAVTRSHHQADLFDL